MHRYSPGPWYVIAALDCVVALPPTTSRDAVDTVGALLLEPGRGPVDLGTVLDALVHAFGGRLSAVPDFAIACLTAEGTQSAVRGTPVILSGVDQASGLSATSWVETRWAAGAAVTMVLADVDDTALPLPVAQGTVLAGRFAVTNTGDREQTPAVSPAAGTARPPARGDNGTVPPFLAPVGGAGPSAPDPMHAEPGGLFEVTPEIEPQPQPQPDPEPGPGRGGAMGDGRPEGEPVPDGETLVSALDDPDVDEYDQILFGETHLASVEEAAVRAPDDAAAADVAAPERFSPQPGDGAPVGSLDEGDHDGDTLSIEQLRALEGAGAVTVAGTSPHPGGLIASVPGSTSRAVMTVSTGETVLLDRGAIVGRRPRLTRVQGLTAPSLVTVPSPNQDISRNHVEIRLEGHSVLAVDLDTTNGTLLCRGAAEPVRLHPGEGTLLVSGDQLDLGETVTLSFAGLE